MPLARQTSRIVWPSKTGTVRPSTWIWKRGVETGRWGAWVVMRRSARDSSSGKTVSMGALSSGRLSTRAAWRFQVSFWFGAGRRYRRFSSGLSAGLRSDCVAADAGASGLIEEIVATPDRASAVAAAVADAEPCPETEVPSAGAVPAAGSASVAGGGGGALLAFESACPSRPVERLRGGLPPGGEAGLGRGFGSRMGRLKKPRRHERLPWDGRPQPGMCFGRCGRRARRGSCARGS